MNAPRLNKLLLLGCLAVLTACGDEVVEAAHFDQATGPYLLVGSVSADFQTGSYGLVDLATMASFPELGSLHPDSLLRFDDGILVAVNRFGADNLQRIDPVTLSTRWQYSTGSGTNPQDVAIIDAHRAYVSLYEEAGLLVVDLDPTDEAGFIVGEVDLSDFADSDGVPEAAALVALGGTVWVALQRLNRDDFFSPTNDSLLIAVDGETGALIDLDDESEGQALTMPCRNPIQVEPNGDDTLLIACSGAFGELDGSIVRFSTTNGTFGAPIVTEADLGGDLTAFTSSDPVYVLWTDDAFVSHVSIVNAQSGAVEGELATDLGNTGDILVNGTQIYVSDRNPETPGLRIFSQDDHTELTSEPISTGLPPLSIAVVDP